MNGIESPILSYSDPIQFSQVPLEEKDFLHYKSRKQKLGK
jgi:hypothetical protein